MLRLRRDAARRPTAEGAGTITNDRPIAAVLAACNGVAQGNPILSRSSAVLRPREKYGVRKARLGPMVLKGGAGRLVKPQQLATDRGEGTCGGQA